MVTDVAVSVTSAPNSVRVGFVRVFLVSIGVFNEKIRRRTN